MHNDVDPAIKFDDGFRTPTGGPQEYVTWDIENTNRQTLFYLHGALHLFDGGDELQKYTWINTGVRLIEQVRRALAANLYPLFVAEGESAQKMDRIRHSDFLSRSLRSFANISGTLVVYGHSFAPNDEHVIRLIERGKVATILVSLYGDPDSSDNRAIVARVNRMQAARHRSRPLETVFFDAATAKVWG